MLVCYFSASGVTKMVAGKIALAISGDLFEIVPTERYTKDDLNWNDANSRSSLEMADRSSRPKILYKANTNYDSIIIGFPVWWDSAPTIINTFIEENDLSGKNVFVFVTSGSSSDRNSFDELKKKYPDINFISSRRFSGSESLDDYKSWILK